MFKVQSIFEVEREAGHRASNAVHQAQGNYAAKYRVRGKWLSVTDLKNGSFLYQFDGNTVTRDRAAYLIATR